MAIVTFDLSGKQTEAKAKMLDLGYKDRWVDDARRTYYLPNTTLWRKEASVERALSDIQAVATALSVVLERAVAVPHEPWMAIQGLPHS